MEIYLVKLNYISVAGEGLLRMPETGLIPMVIPDEKWCILSVSKEEAGESSMHAPEVKDDLETDALTYLIDEAETKGFLRGAADAESKFNQQLEISCVLISEAVRAINMESESMMIQMEAEVIKLSLEVASKILCRESQINPLFLAETARLSLQKIKATTELILHVAPENFSSWQQIMSASQEKATGLRIVEDQSVQAGMCFFKCGGSVLDLSLDTQLGEISHKFSELFASANPGHGLYDRIKA